MTLTWLLRGDAFCSLGCSEGQSLWPSDRLSHCVSQVHDHQPQEGTMAQRVQQRQTSPPRRGRGAEEERHGRGTGRTVRGCWLPRKMWMSIWWGAHWRWRPKLREGCERERRGWMLTWAWPQRAGTSHLFLNPLSLEHIRPRKRPDHSRDPCALSRSCLTAFLEKLSGQRDSRPGRWKIHR